MAWRGINDMLDKVSSRDLLGGSQDLIFGWNKDKIVYKR